MSKQTRAFIEQAKSGESPGLAQTLKEIGGQVWDGAKPMFDHGRTELAAALFSGHGYVMYMRDGKEGVEQTQNHKQESPEVQQDMGREL
jgi:hypothetical protein